MKLAALLLTAGLAGTAPQEPAQVVEMEKGEASQLNCTADSGCVAMSRALFEALVQRAAQIGGKSV